MHRLSVCSFILNAYYTVYRIFVKFGTEGMALGILIRTVQLGSHVHKYGVLSLGYPSLILVTSSLSAHTLKELISSNSFHATVVSRSMELVA